MIQWCKSHDEACKLNVQEMHELPSNFSAYAANYACYFMNMLTLCFGYSSLLWHNAHYKKQKCTTVQFNIRIQIQERTTFSNLWLPLAKTLRPQMPQEFHFNFTAGFLLKHYPFLTLRLLLICIFWNWSSVLKLFP